MKFALLSKVVGAVAASAVAVGVGSVVPVQAHGSGAAGVASSEGRAATSGERAAEVRVRVSSRKTGPKDGYGQVTGRLLIGKSAKTISFSGTVDDMCPADGFESFVTAYFYYSNRLVDTKTVRDNRGCTKSGVRFNIARNAPSGARVVRVVVLVGEIATGSNRYHDGVTKTYNIAVN